MTKANFHLVVRKGPQPGTIFPLTLDTISVGRDPMSDIALDDPEVSRHHARLRRTPAGYELQDMGSTNGTFAAGQRLKGDPVLLQPGQSVAFGGNVVLDYQQSAADPLETIAMPHDLEPLPPLPGSEEESVEVDVPEIEVLDSGQSSVADWDPSAEMDDLLQTMDELHPPDEPAGRAEAPAGSSKSDFESLFSPEPGRKRRKESVPPIIDPGSSEQDPNRTLKLVLGGAAVALLLCCCCTLVTYFWLGDIVMQALGAY